MQQNKTSRYFKYAIGEIILVVIGILIALQINNWNENRKLLKLESNLLIDVIANLEANKKMLETGLIINKKTKDDYEIILNYIENDLPYDSIVKTAFHTIRNWHSPFFTFTAYESLKSKGLDIINNDNIKQDIAYMYEDNFAYLVNDYDKAEWELSQSVKLPLLNKYIRNIKKQNGDYNSEPINFNAIKKDDEFINLLSHMAHTRNRGIKHYQRVINDINSLNMAIRDYL
jgi:hypothetical protein